MMYLFYRPMWCNLKSNLKAVRTISFVQNRFSSNNHLGYNMDQIYVRYIEGREAIDLSFKVKQENGIFKDFNFSRRQNETIAVSLERIQASLITKLNKKKRKTKSSPEGDTSEVIKPPIQVSLMNGSTAWDTSILSRVAWTYPESCLQIGDVSYQIVLNPPSVSKLKVPSCIMVGYSVIPLIEHEFTNLAKSNFTWYREESVPSTQCDTDTKKRKRSESTDIVKSYVEVGNRLIYTPSIDDLGKRLKVVCRPCEGNREGIAVESLSKECVIDGPQDCPFLNRHKHTSSLCDDSSFRVVSYNILADVYADSNFSREFLFPHCPADNLAMKYRKNLIFRELQGYNADVICLQEVDEKIFTRVLLPLFTELGFDGKYCGKYKNSTMDSGTNDVPDLEAIANGTQVKVGDKHEFEKKLELEMATAVGEGSAIFYRNSKFRPTEQYRENVTDVLKTDVDLWTKIETNYFLKASLKKRTTVVQATLLENVNWPDKKILVATSHLFYHPRANNIRLLQTLGCIKLIQSILDSRKDEDICVVFCGDLNAPKLNAVHELLTKGAVKATHVDWFSGGKREFVCDMNVETNMTFTSACGYPQYTNFVPSFNACLDYVYINNKLAVERVIPLPSHEEVAMETALPNRVFPSDHLALVCDLSWK